MSRYIDADALKEKYTMVTKRYSGGIMERPAVLLESIDEAPSIDIVRCKECTRRDDDYVCYKWASVDECPHVNPDDFCSYGERRETVDYKHVVLTCDAEGNWSMHGERSEEWEDDGQ